MLTPSCDPSPEQIAEQARAIKEEHLRAKRLEGTVPAPSKRPRTLPPREATELSQKYHGISWTGWKWRAKALDPATGKSVHSADFDDPAEAARAYDKLLVQVNRLAAEPNFPDEMPASWRARATGPAKQTLPWAAEIKPKTEPAPEPERPAHKFRGITLRRNGDWVAQVKIPGSGTKMTWIARCRTAEEAARKYDAYVAKHDLGKPLNYPDEHPGYSPRPGMYRARPHEAKAFVSRMMEAEAEAAEPKSSRPGPVAEEAAPPLLVARLEPANPWGRLQAKIEAVADLLSVLRRHPADVGRDALMYIMESTR